MTLSAVPERTVVIPITATGQNGAAAGDWSVAPTSVTFASDDTSKALTLAADDDAVDDDGESVLLGFGALPERVGADPAAATATVAIVDDDDRGVELSETRLAVAEGEVGSYTVRLRSQPTGAVTVTVTGHAGTDVAPDPESLHYTPQNWDAPQTVQVTAGQDDDSDDDTATLAHTAAGGDYTGAETAEVAVTVADDDHPRVQVGFAPGARSAAEGAAAELRVVLDRDPQRSLRIPLAATGLGGATPDDWSGVPAAVTFEAGATEAAFALTATNDDIDDDGESVEVAFGPLPERVGADPAAATATVAIDDDDHPRVAVSFAKAAHSVDEGDGVVVEVTLSAVPERTVVIPITATGQNGAAAGDWSVAPASVTFASGDTSKAFTVAADDDAVDDDGESVLLGFGALPERVSAGTTAAAEVSIVDDDTAAVAASVSSLSVAEGGEETYTVELGSEPTAAVTVDGGGRRRRRRDRGPGRADVHGVRLGQPPDRHRRRRTRRRRRRRRGHSDPHRRRRRLRRGLGDGGGDRRRRRPPAGGRELRRGVLQRRGERRRRHRRQGGPGGGDGDAERRSRAHGGDPDHGDRPGRRHRRRLVRGAHQRSPSPGDAPPRQAFTLTAAGDDVDDDGETRASWASALLPERVGADPAAATATVAIDDDDDRGVELSETRLAVAEGEVGSYTVRLRSQPTGAVTVTVTGHAGTDVAPDPESLHYTPQNWDAPQTVQVAAGQDGRLRRRHRHPRPHRRRRRLHRRRPRRSRGHRRRRRPPQGPSRVRARGPQRRRGRRRRAAGGA